MAVTPGDAQKSSRGCFSKSDKGPGDDGLCRDELSIYALFHLKADERTVLLVSLVTRLDELSTLKMASRLQRAQKHSGSGATV